MSTCSKKLTGRVRHRAFRIPFTKRVVLVLQVEEHETGAINSGTRIEDERPYEHTGWRDATVEDLTLEVPNAG